MPAMPWLYLITDDKGRKPEELAELIENAIMGGVNLVQFREKSSGPTAAARAFQLLSAVCQRANVPLLINADLLGRFPLDVPFAGIHYSNRTLPVHPCTKAPLAGYSAHGHDDAAAAFSHGVHFCTISPIFETPSKAGILDPIGLDSLKSICSAQSHRNFIALGGIDDTRVQDCLQAGVKGVAVIRGIMDSSDPCDAAKKLSLAMENHKVE